MKKFLLLFAVFGLLGLVNANAQCSKSSAAAGAGTKACCATTAAAKAAALDQSIQKRVSAQTGEVTFVRKNVCATSGKVSYTSVEYCTKSGKFVNVSPSAKPSCTGKSARGTATKVASAEGKAGCTPAEKAACCAKSKAKAELKTEQEEDHGKAGVKLIKNSGQK